MSWKYGSNHPFVVTVTLEGKIAFWLDDSQSNVKVAVYGDINHCPLLTTSFSAPAPPVFDSFPKGSTASLRVGSASEGKWNSIQEAFFQKSESALPPTSLGGYDCFLTVDISVAGGIWSPISSLTSVPTDVGKIAAWWTPQDDKDPYSPSQGKCPPSPLIERPEGVWADGLQVIYPQATSVDFHVSYHTNAPPVPTSVTQSINFHISSLCAGVSLESASRCGPIIFLAQSQGDH
jgi:hypothetical protein